MSRIYKIGKESHLFIDLTNIKFGKLTAIDYVEYVTKNDNKSFRWKCQCDCGEELFVRTNLLTSGKQRMCKKCANKLIGKKNRKPNNLSLKKRIFKQYKNGAKNRNLNFEIEFDTFLEMITCKCYYCGSEPKINLGDSKYFQTGEFKRNGLDRINAKLGYIDNNVVTCCETCNRAKLSMSEEEFYSWIYKIYNNLKLNRKTFNDYSERKYIQANGNSDNP